MSEQTSPPGEGVQWHPPGTFRADPVGPSEPRAPEYIEAAAAFNAVGARLGATARALEQLADDLAKRPELIPLDAAWRKAQRLEHALAVDLPEHRRLLVELWGHSAQAKGGLDATGQSGEDQSAPYRELGADTADAILDLIDRRIDAALTEQRERLKAAG